MYSSILLLKQQQQHQHQCSRSLSNILILTRGMGGGPRTFPDGLNKWQWKRMHEKKAKEKERKLLEHEKQLYQARIRSDIRAKLISNGSFSSNSSNESSNSSGNYSPMSPREQIKALADRFMKEGAEDLWNEDDGPSRSDAVTVRHRLVAGREQTPVDLKKLVSGPRGISRGLDDNACDVFNGYNFSKESRRHYSTCSNSVEFGISKFNVTSHLLVLDCCGNIAFNVKTTRNYSGVAQRVNFVEHGKSGMKRRGSRRNESSSEDDDDSEDDESQKNMEFRNKDKRSLGSSAALGKYDVRTIRRRVPLAKVEDEVDFAQQIEMIKHDWSKKNRVERGGQGEEESLLSEKRFDEFGISPLTIKALSEAGYVQMTRVQEASLSVAIEGTDALVKAKTGTGKSAAFLLPAIETVVKAMNGNNNQRVSPIYVLILCPTRELASQVAAEGNVMLKYHDGISVQTLVGGTRFKLDQKRLESDPCQIIVATPGRLLDHIENKSSFSVRLMGLKVLVLDEADHLLDLGFRKDVEKIVDCLPRQRQSLLFSATMPKEVRRMSQLVLKKEHEHIDTVGLGCVETHAKVKQSYLVAPHQEHFEIVHHILKEHLLKTLNYKVIIFCTTAMITSLMYLLLHELKMNVREIHSRKPQLYRTRISDEFKDSNRLILVTSDVSSRGMNYPDVTLVIQVGIPPDREQYIHRLGRTGREGKEGEGILLLAPWEEYFMDEIKELPVERYPTPHLEPNMRRKIADTMDKIDPSIRESAYHSWLGYYNSIGEIGRDKTTLVELANEFSESIKLQKTPALFRKTAVRMGLRHVPGIRIRK